MDSGPRRSRRERAADGETTQQSPFPQPPSSQSPFPGPSQPPQSARTGQFLPPEQPGQPGPFGQSGTSGQSGSFGQSGAFGQSGSFGQPPYSSQSAQSAQPGQPEQSEQSPQPQQSRVGWSPYDEGRRSRAPLWFAIGGVLLLGLLGGGLALMWNADGPSTAAAGAPTRTSAPLPSAPPGKYGFAAERKTDPDPITVKEIFGSTKKINVSGRSYEMTVTSKDKKCTDGALGDKLQKALKSGKCTQFLRASFRDKSGKVIGTIGVANLKTSGTASKVAKVGDASNYVKPLAGKDSVTKMLGSGSGGAKISAHGHYAIMVWFQNKDGSKPDKKESKRILEAIKDLSDATVFKALDNRSMTGSALS
ncbi:hypothetical protein [Nonomuraea sp. NPDC005692]|uniref:hypothetical protein n=1 Tax=Nonomuraea sp. NPDC005692 TaxID=3157168 RepID=UPI0033FD4DE2